MSPPKLRRELRMLKRELRILAGECYPSEQRPLESGIMLTAIRRGQLYYATGGGWRKAGKPILDD